MSRFDRLVTQYLVEPFRTRQARTARVDSDIELVGSDPLEEATVVTDHAAEGAIETGVMRFRFSGQLANVHVVDWNSVPAPESSSTPEIHIDYGVPGRKNSS